MAKKIINSAPPPLLWDTFNTAVRDINSNFDELYSGYGGSGAGIQGYTGSRGPTGYTGSRGTIGYTGSKGQDGIIGVDGYTGSRGELGYTGSAGQDGIIGVDGYTGSQGELGYTGSIGYTGSASTVSGYTGSLGYTGSIGYAGSASTVPGYTGSQGAVGYAGSQGAQGTTGYTGSRGDTGYTGSLGFTGSIGYAGSASTVPGYTGSRGDTGYTGSAGQDGIIGVNGYTGSRGELGYTGSKGDIGYTGSAGPSNIINAVDDTSTSTLYPVLTPAIGSDQTVKGTNDISFNAGTSTFNFTNVYIGSSLVVNDIVISGIKSPTNDSDAATKAYVDALVEGLSWKQSANLLADSNVSLTGSTGTLVIDSHPALDSGDTGYRILLTNQSTDSENGIYEYSDNGSTYTLTRPADADVYTELIGSSIFIVEGTIYSSTSWVQNNHYITDFTGQNWVQISQSGLIGYTGSQGNIGYTGSQGATGYVGSASTEIGYTGSQGIQGDIGYTGSQGIKGDTGYTGSQGDLGYTGSQGDIGYTGSASTEIGYTGSRGQDGIIGVDGYTGSQGDLGYTGSQGDTGYTGSQGADGTSITILGSVNSELELPGYPTSYTGSIGDAFIINGDLYVWGDEGSWINVGPIQGPIGYTGSQGDIGPIGYTGSQGYLGLQGDPGYVGSQGDIGYTGSQGIQGDTGYTGSQGIQGIQGDAGYTGSQGDTGYVGSQGDAGYTGSQGDTGYVGSQGIQGDTGYTGSQGDQGISGDTGYTGSQGIQGDIGYTGSNGNIGYTGSQGKDGQFGGASFYYTYDSTLYGGTVGSGYVTLDSTDTTAVTLVALSDTDRFNTNIASFIQTIDDSTSDVKGYLKFTEEANSTNFAIFAITGNHTLHLGHYHIPVSYVSGATSTPVDDTNCILTFTVTGDKGDKGDIGYTGSQGDLGYTGSQGNIGYVGSQGDIGYTGSVGPGGSSVTVSDVAPTGALSGDLWWNSAVGDMLVFYNDGTSSQWVSASKKGAAGPQGEIGYTGSQGAVGYAGSAGTDGLVGYTGSVGSQGAVGYTGSAGSGTYPKFSAYPSATQSFLNYDLFKVNFQTEEFDTNGNYDAANSRFTPTVAGYYYVRAAAHCNVEIADPPVPINTSVYLYKNGEVYKTLGSSTITGMIAGATGSVLVYCNGTTDYLEIYAEFWGLDSYVLNWADYTYFQAFLTP